MGTAWLLQIRMDVPQDDRPGAKRVRSLPERGASPTLLGL